MNTSVRYNEVLGMVHQLSEQEFDKLLVDLKRINISGQRENRVAAKPTKIQQLLLQAPTWSDEDYNTFQEARNNFYLWRK